jgi:hypothetical protein
VDSGAAAPLPPHAVRATTKSDARAGSRRRKSSARGMWGRRKPRELQHSTSSWRPGTVRKLHSHLSYAGGTPSTMTTVTNLPDSGMGVEMGGPPHFYIVTNTGKWSNTNTDLEPTPQPAAALPPAPRPVPVFPAAPPPPEAQPRGSAETGLPVRLVGEGIVLQVADRLRAAVVPIAHVSRWFVTLRCDAGAHRSPVGHFRL